MSEELEIVGKEVLSYEKHDTYITINFTDGTYLQISARGTEEQWISIDEGTN